MKKAFIHVRALFVVLFVAAGTVQAVSMQDQQLLAKQLLEQNFPSIESIIDQNAVNELGINKEFRGCFGNPQTLFGQLVQEFLITHPTRDTAIIEQRVEIIKTLKNSPELQAELLAQYKRIAESQDGFFSYWQEDDEIVKRALSKIYFSDRYGFLNTNPVALELSRGVEIASKIPSFIPMEFYFIGGTLLAEYVMNRTKGFENASLPGLKEIPLKACVNTFKTIARGHDPRRSVTLTKEDCLFPDPQGIVPEATFGDQIYNFNHPEASVGLLTNVYETAGLEDIATMVRNNGSKAIKAMIALTWAGRLAFDFMWGRASKISTEALIDRKKTVLALHTSIRKVAELNNALQSIYKIAASDLALSQLNGFVHLKTLCEQAQVLSKDMAQLIDLLNTDSVKGTMTTFAFQGRILAAHQLMKKEKHLFGAGLYAIGELEVYLEIAGMMKNNLTCFVEFTENGSTDSRDIYLINPMIKAMCAYNPVIKSGICSQDLFVGGKSIIRNMLITGPNGCGKSTVIKTLAYTIVSAQSFGIAFADSCLMTPFTRLLNYSKIEDDLENGMSTFMAEAKRIEDIRKEVATGNGRIAVFMDEALKGTFGETGEKMLYAFCKEMTTYPHCFLADATHFEYPTELEFDTNGAIRNFHLEPKELGFGEFEPVYALRSGKAVWWFNDAAKRESYITWLNTQIKN